VETSQCGMRVGSTAALSPERTHGRGWPLINIDVGCADCRMSSEAANPTPNRIHGSVRPTDINAFSIGIIIVEREVERGPGAAMFHLLLLCSPLLRKGGITECQSMDPWTSGY